MFIKEIKTEYVPTSVETENASNPKKAAKIAAAFIGKSTKETFMVLLLNTLQEVTAMETVSVGTVETTLVHPREVFRSALVANATAIIVAHNHPSGSLNASLQDIEVTRRLVIAGNIIGIPLLDSLIVNDSGGWSSIRDQKGFMFPSDINSWKEILYKDNIH